MDKVLSNTRVMASSIGVTRLCRALESQLGEDPMQRFAYGLCWRVSTFVCAICADPMSNAHARYDCRILPPSAPSPSLQSDRGGHATVAGAGVGAGAGAGVGTSGSAASVCVDAGDSAAYVAIAKRTTPSSVPLTPLPLEVACLAANRGRLIVDGITMEDLEVALDTQIAPGHQVRVCVCVCVRVCVCVAACVAACLCVAVCGCVWLYACSAPVDTGVTQSHTLCGCFATQCGRNMVAGLACLQGFTCC